MKQDLIMFGIAFVFACFFVCVIIPTALDREIERQEIVEAHTYQHYGQYMERKEP